MALDQQHWMITVALVTSSLIALVANLLLLLVFCRKRGLRTVSNRFTINLLLANLLSSVLLIPLLIVDQKVSISRNIKEYSSNTFQIFVEKENSTLPNNVIVKELKEKEIIASGLFEETENVVIYDKFKLNFGVNRSDVLEERASDLRELTYLNKVNNETLSNIMCYLAQSTVGLVCTASILSVLLIGIDQYFAVIHSLRYHFYVDKFRSMVLIITSWLVAIFFAILGGFTQSESNLWHFCPRSFNASISEAPFKTLNSIYAVTYFIFVIFLPFVAICIIYVCIYYAARNNSERMRKSTKSNSQPNLDPYLQITTNFKMPNENRTNLEASQSSGYERGSTKMGLHKVQSAPNFLNLVEEKETPRTVKRTCSDRVGFITNLKYKISNVSVFRYREETRAAKISILVIFMVLVCYIPYGLAVVLNSYAVDLKTPAFYNYVSLVLLVFSNVASPLLFAYRNRRIRRELLRFLGIIPVRSANLSFQNGVPRRQSAGAVVVENRDKIAEECERVETGATSVEPFLNQKCSIPQVVVTCKIDNNKTERASILKRVCSTKNWPNYKKCSFITVPESCWQTDSARGSFSSASTQISVED